MLFCVPVLLGTSGLWFSQGAPPGGRGPTQKKIRKRHVAAPCRFFLTDRLGYTVGTPGAQPVSCFMILWTLKLATQLSDLNNPYAAA